MPTAEWRRIADAPRDGTQICALDGDDEPLIVCWNKRAQGSVEHGSLKALHVLVV